LTHESVILIQRIAENELENNKTSNLDFLTANSFKMSIACCKCKLNKKFASSVLPNLIYFAGNDVLNRNVKQHN